MDLIVGERQNTCEKQKESCHHKKRNYTHKIEIVKPENWSYDKKAVAAIFAEHFYEKNKKGRGDKKK